MIRIRALVILCLCFLILVGCSPLKSKPTPHYSMKSMSEGAAESLIPHWGVVNLSPNQQPLYNKYPVSSYVLDVEPTSFFVPLLEDLCSLEMYTIAALAKFTIYLFQWSYSLTAFDQLIVPVGKFIDALVNKLFFGNLFLLALIGTGVSLIFALGKNRDVFGKILQVFVNLILSFVLLVSMPSIMEGLNTLTRGQSDLVLTTYGQVDPNAQVRKNLTSAESALVTIGEQFFKYNVYIPWQIAEFGSYPIPSGRDTKGNLIYKGVNAQLNQDSNFYLSMNPLNQKQSIIRLRKTQDYTDSSMTRDIYNTIVPAKLEIQPNPRYPSMTALGIYSRFFIVNLALLIGTVYGGFLLLMSGALILLQFFVLLLAMFTPLIFLLVLIPDVGELILTRWTQTMLLTALYRVVISIFLASLLFIQGMIYYTGSTQSWGWGFIMFSQIVSIISIWVFRKQLKNLVPLTGFVVAQATEDQIRRMTGQGAKLVKNTAKTVAAVASAGAAGGGAVITGGKAVLEGGKKVGSEIRKGFSTFKKGPTFEKAAKSSFVPTGFTTESKKTGHLNPFSDGKWSENTKVFNDMQKNNLNPYNSNDRNDYLNHIKKDTNGQGEDYRSKVQAIQMIGEIGNHFESRQKQNNRKSSLKEANARRINVLSHLEIAESQLKAKQLEKKLRGSRLGNFFKRNKDDRK